MGRADGDRRHRRHAEGRHLRLTLTDFDREVRDWFKSPAEALGCTVMMDDMGAMFARCEGQQHDIPPIAMCSHLDTPADRRKIRRRARRAGGACHTPYPR
jgi:acetylornithine deacetylase/succinyl-diaminopimelate desuccinylase-like protein